MRHKEIPAFGEITSGLAPDTFILRTIDFVYTQLPAWRDDPDRVNEQSENKLNLQLCKFLDAHARNNFPMVFFQHEEYQSGHASVDISALPIEIIVIGAKTYNMYNPIVVFEGKRLPAPSHDREKEYVTGGNKKSGGIQRFKLRIHGKDNDIAAMIGYLQANSPYYWFNEINQWIINLCNGISSDICGWNSIEKLVNFKEDILKGTATCRSTHDRKGGVQNNKISIHHLWVNMNN